jgi:Uma2 family endonuclease
VIAAPIDIIIRKAPQLRTRQPDMCYLNSDKTGIRTRRDAQRMPAIEVAPDLVVELLSSDERRQSLAGKLADYAVLGVLEAWLVSPEAETIEVLSLEGESHARCGLFGRGDFVKSAALPGLNLAVDSIVE